MRSLCFPMSLIAMLLVLGSLAACGNGDLVVADFDGNCDGLEGPGAVVGLDVGSGEVLWERTIGGVWGVAMADGVVAGAGSSGAAFGVEASSGELLWCKDFGKVSQEGSIVLPGFAASGDVFATAMAGGDVVGLDPRAGSELWRTEIGLIEGLHVESGVGSFVVRDAAAAESHLMDLDANTGAAADLVAKDGDDVGFALTVDHPFVENRQLVNVSIQEDDLRLWDKSLPGFEVALHGDAVVVIDQTGGTGVVDGRVDTRVSAYDASTGVLRWQVPLPGTPHLTADAGLVIVVPVGAEIYAFNSETGDTVWTTDVGSPGRGGPYSLPGTFQFLELDDSVNTTLVGLIIAERPYRD